VKRTLAIAALLATAWFGSVSAQELDAVDQIRLREAFRLMEASAPRWKGWEAAPSPVLLVVEDHEFFVGHSRPEEDFTPLDIASIEGRDVFVRERVFAPNLLATFPAVDGIPTIVIGTPEATGLSSTRWVVTLVHEHFHQLQMSQPDYFRSVDRLDLSGGDDTGMWMLNYPFPYSAEQVAAEVNRLGAMASSLVQSLERGVTDEDALAVYLSQRRAVEDILAPRDFRYFSFQLWQEGLARHAEVDAALHASEVFEFSSEFRDLPDYEPLSRVVAEIRDRTLAELDSDVSESGRFYFYALGATEGEILDVMRPGWRGRYLSEPFAVHDYFEPGP